MFNVSHRRSTYRTTCTGSSNAGLRRQLVRLGLSHCAWIQVYKMWLTCHARRVTITSSKSKHILTYTKWFRLPAQLSLFSIGFSYHSNNGPLRKKSKWLGI